MTSSPIQHHLSKISVAVAICQLALVRLVLLMDENDALMSLVDGGVLFLPLSLLLAGLTYYALRSKRWLLSSFLLPFCLPFLLLSTLSLYLRIT